MSDPWTFGWTQTLTIIGFAITSLIAWSGFRSFDRWKRERLEDKRIEISFDALSIAYESKFVFGTIRNPQGYEIEWKDMPIVEGESEDDRGKRGVSYAILKRMNEQRAYFDSVIKLQPKFMAVFGDAAGDIFRELFEARDMVRFAAQELTWKIPVVPAVRSNEDFEMRMRLRADLWQGFAGYEDRVEAKLRNYRANI
jgi:hypothetical protein